MAKSPKVNIPKPNKAVRGSKTGRPVMALLDLLGRRWALRILWELRDETLTFRALQQASGGLSPSVLNTRLTELRETALVDLTDEGYALTPLGRSLLAKLSTLDSWVVKWAKALN